MAFSIRFGDEPVNNYRKTESSPSSQKGCCGFLGVVLLAGAIWSNSKSDNVALTVSLYVTSLIAFSLECAYLKDDKPTYRIDRSPPKAEFVSTVAQPLLQQQEDV